MRIVAACVDTMARTVLSRCWIQLHVPRGGSMIPAPGRLSAAAIGTLVAIGRDWAPLIEQFDPS